jgi:hypothetical protein
MERTIASANAYRDSGRVEAKDQPTALTFARRYHIRAAEAMNAHLAYFCHADAL